MDRRTRPNMETGASEHGQLADTEDLVVLQSTLSVPNVIADKEIEFALETVIPFLAKHALAYTMCETTAPGRTHCTESGSHVHTWCEPCAEQDPGFSGHGNCSECVALRTMSVLSNRWKKFCWERLRRED